MTDIERMKAELEAEGYEYHQVMRQVSSSFAKTYNIQSIYILKGTFYCEGNIDYITTQAYAHLQERKELEALRAFVLRSNSDNLDIWDDQLWLHVSDEADELIKQYNITADDESDDDDNS